MINEEKFNSALEDPWANIFTSIMIGGTTILDMVAKEGSKLENISSILFWTALGLSVLIEVIAYKSKRSVKERYSPGFIKFGRVLFSIASVILSLYVIVCMCRIIFG